MHTFINKVTKNINLNDKLQCVDQERHFMQVQADGSYRRGFFYFHLEKNTMNTLNMNSHYFKFLTYSKPRLSRIQVDWGILSELRENPT